METFITSILITVFVILFWIINELRKDLDKAHFINRELRNELRKAHLVNQSLMDNQE